MKKTFGEIMTRIEKARKDNIPFVICKLPYNKNVKAYIQQDSTLYYQTNDYQNGFVFAPFDDRKKTILFPASHCDYLEGKMEIATTYNETESKYFQEFSTPKSLYINKVAKAINWLRINNYQKIVWSRKEALSLPEFSLDKIFNKLISAYNDAFTYIWFHPKIGLWIGATPETLVAVSHNQFKTMSLAGTQVYQNNMEISWQAKEICEQQIVTDYIVNELSEFELNISNPISKIAGSLVHLCSEITGRLHHKNQLINLIQKLHPTPAVCGMPKEITKNFILENEEYDRSFYTGYLGIIDTKRNDSGSEELQVNLFVNLRCMELNLHIKTENNVELSLYIGGGITADSIPEKEYEETVAKSKIMKSIL